MLYKQSQDGRFVEIFIRALELSVAVIGFIALLGWVSGIREFTSFGRNLKPMSLISAILFLLTGLSAYLYTSTPNKTKPRLFSLSVAIITIFIPLLLLFLSNFGLYSKDDIFYIPIEKAMHAIPGANISPLSALSFTSVGIALLLLLLNHRSQTKKTIIVFWISFIIIEIHYILVLAYISGPSLLYSGKFIPPSMPSNLAFIAIGLALALCSQRKTFNDPESVDASFARSSITLVIIFYYHINEYGYYRLFLFPQLRKPISA